MTTHANPDNSADPSTSTLDTPWSIFAHTDFADPLADTIPKDLSRSSNADNATQGGEVESYAVVQV
jgi:hypothetical protein